MKIGVLGVGLMGGKLGVLLAQAGHQVVLSYSRRTAKLEALAREGGGSARAGTPAEAVRESDVILLAVHWSRLDDVLAQAGDLSGKIVVTCCVPLDDADSELVVGHSDSGAEQIARRLPNTAVAAAFQTTPSESFFPVFEARDQALKPSCVYCGDDPRAKRAAAEMIAAIGFEPVDAGPLPVARYTEPFALLTAQLAYGSGDGPDWTYRFARFERLFCET
ncbi:NADPH-dependent F420 reductase [Salinicola avicenniae]|uniref:NADPH-dependent F420 reductase n=1 Tax=Salinicola avicenniae TaxID=2916836 RepID=UPI00207322DD|nr:NAD(P)-binding domain-containing protein [Salinicola sp. S1-1-8]